MGKITIKGTDFNVLALNIISNRYDFLIEKESYTIEGLTSFLTDVNDYDIITYDENDQPSEDSINTFDYPFLQVTEDNRRENCLHIMFESIPYEVETVTKQNEANIDYMAIMLDIDLSEE